MKSTIIIPNYNQHDILIECVDSIKKFHKEPIIIYDDGSSREVQSKISTIQDTTILLSGENKGFGHACNTGIESANTGFVVLVNNDIILTEPILKEFESIFEKDPKIGIIGMRLHYPNGYIQHSGHRIVDRERFHMVHYEHGEDPKRARLAYKSRYIVSVTGALVAMRKFCIEQIGGFGEGYKNCYEDSELCLRAWHNDWKVYYTGKIGATHKEGFTRGVTSEDKFLKGTLESETSSYHQYQKDVSKYNYKDLMNKVEAANENWD